jgi:hypothetical protein
MQNDKPHVYVMPVVSEKLPTAPTTPPPTQRDLVKASLLARPSPD